MFTNTAMSIIQILKGFTLIRPALNLHQGFPTIHIQRAKCQTNPPSKKTTEHLVTKRTKILPRDGVFSQKNKKESFLPPLKTKQNKNFPYQIERKNKTLHYSVLVSLS